MPLIARAPAKLHEKIGVIHYRPGDELVIPGPGDIVLTHGTHFFSQLIRLGQRIRYRRNESQFAQWNHVAIGVGDGEIVEALSAGISKRHISEYRDEKYAVVEIEASEESRQQMLDYVLWIESLGKRYGWLMIGAITIQLLVGGRFTFNLDGSEICSTLAAEALKSAGYRFNRRLVLPADLAWYFDVGLEDV